MLKVLNNDVWNDGILWSVIAFRSVTTNSAVIGNLASSINNWNDFSKYFYELIKSSIVLHDQMSY